MAERSNQEWVQQFASWAYSDGAEDPLLLTGPPAGDWAALTTRLACLVVCERQEDCGECRSCRLAATGKHGEVVQLQTEEARIKIKDVQHVREVLQGRPMGGRRFVLLSQAERLTLDAGNALLKMLEENSKYNRIVLTSSYPGRLLPTIRSRVQRRAVGAWLEPSKEQGNAAPSVDEVLSSFSARRKQPLEEHELEAIYYHLQELLAEGPSATAAAGLMRWRDYYRVAAAQGNTRLASDMLLATLGELGKNRKGAISH